VETSAFSLSWLQFRPHDWNKPTKTAI